MPATMMTCIAKDFGLFYRITGERDADLLPYREITYQPDDMPGFILGKSMATVDEVKESVAKKKGETDEFFWDEPDDAERAAVPGVVFVLRYVDMRNASAAYFRLRASSAAGELRSLPIRMAAQNANGLFAWIETKDDIDTVLVARLGTILFTRLLGGVNSRDWGYEGCQARLLKWYGDRLIVVSFERGNYIRSIEPLTGEETGLWLSAWNESWLIDDDLLLWLDDQRGLVRTAALPSLQPGLPIPFHQPSDVSSYQIQLKRRAKVRFGVFHSGGGGQFLAILTLPSVTQRAAFVEAGNETADRVLDGIDSNLFPDRRAPWPARLVLEAFSYPFLREATSEPAWRPSPIWLPIYWHHHLIATGREQEAHELLNWLDRIAAPLPPETPSTGWLPEWDLGRARIAFASAHVRRTCRVVAEAFRGGKLPKGTSCLLFDPLPGTEARGSRVDSSRFPLVLRQAFEELRLSGSSSLRLA